MRVFVMVSSLAMGGAERNIVSILPRLQRTGIDCRLVSLNRRRDGPLAEHLEHHGIERFDLAARRMLDPPAWRRFAQLVRDQEPDLVHAHDLDTTIYAAITRRRLGLPAVMTRHVIEEPHGVLRANIRAGAALMAARYGFDRIITVSEAVRQRFSRLARIPVSRIETIYNGIDFTPFSVQYDRVATRAALGLGADVPVVIMVAVFRPQKGHEVLFDAIPRLQEAVPDVQIVLAGDGDLRPQLTLLAQPYGDTVRFLGQRIDIPALLAASDVLVLPSWQEALPTVLIEAGGAGLPAVATDVGGAAEIIQDGQTGYIVPPGAVDSIAERLITLLQAPEHAATMGQLARKRVSAMFSIERQVQHTVALYERVLSDYADRQ
ncbi:MAG: glycosyltransferase family 4 protein [Chloroflexi bacterium]|nr:glycosyltransferase family 4 protein [Chloroflexota bacterium]